MLKFLVLLDRADFLSQTILDTADCDLELVASMVSRENPVVKNLRAVHTFKIESLRTTFHKRPLQKQST